MKRIKEWDFFKGILVIMIILGHATASLGTYESPPILEYCSSLTVSFIMPMFLVITGYFIYSFKTDTLTPGYILKKAKRLLIPAVIWGGIGGIFIIILESLPLWPINTMTIIIFLRNIKYLWYLYGTFVSALIIWSVEKITNQKYKNIILVGFAIVSHLIPTDLWNISFSFPFILTGYYLRKNHFSLEWFNTHKCTCFGLLGIYLFVLYFYSYDYSVYVAGTNFITNAPFVKQLYIVIFRFAIGISGTICISFLAHLFYTYFDNNILVKTIELLGENSLEMYCTQFIIIERIFTWLMNLLTQSTGISFVSHPYLCYFLWRHLFGFLLIAITYILVSLLKKTPLGHYIY